MGFAILTMNKELPAIIERIDGLRDLFIEKFKENSENHLRIENQNVNDHNRIETQAIKTNGRLRMLEKFMWCCGGGMSVLVFFLNYWVIPDIKSLQKAQAETKKIDEEQIKKLISEVVDSK